MLSGPVQIYHAIMRSFWQ